MVVRHESKPRRRKKWQKCENDCMKKRVEKYEKTNISNIHMHMQAQSLLYVTTDSFIHSFIHLQSIDPVYSHNRQQDVDLVKS
jgi:hypothetical protein